jgi:spermidine/putrescine ABC transporter ATP-binding subunit
MSYLDIDQVSVNYGEFEALKDASLQLAQGEFFTLLGPSGCGKSTLLLSIAGFVKPSAGTISLQGQNMTNMPPNKRDMGMVFQSYALFPHKNVFQNVAYPLQIRHRPKDEVASRVKDMLELVALDHAGERRPHKLSGGQQQRVAIARALSFSPRLLLLDEPFGALDKKLRDQMQIEIRHIQRASGATAMFVTHDQEEAMAISDRIAVMRKGRIEQVGTPEDIYQSPGNAFVADFVGGANFLEVDIYNDEENADTCTVKYRDEAIENIPKPDWLIRRRDRGVLFARPEHLSLTATEATEGVVGQVEDHVYLGTTRKFKVRLPDGLLIEAVQAAGADRIESGRAVRIEMKPDKTKLFNSRPPLGS